MKSLKIKHNRKQKFLESTTNYIIYLHAIGISSLAARGIKDKCFEGIRDNNKGYRLRREKRSMGSCYPFFA
jgi:hypothetical protein